MRREAGDFISEPFGGDISLDEEIFRFSVSARGEMRGEIDEQLRQLFACWCESRE